MKLITANAKVLNDKGLVTEANDAVLKNKPAFIQSALGLHTAAIQQGRITPEKVMQDASDYFDANIRTALYNPKKMRTKSCKVKTARTKRHNRAKKD